MLDRFRVSCVRCVLMPLEPLPLPGLIGNTLRGAFGLTFKRLVCPTPGDCRTECRDRAACPYGALFEPAPPPDASRLSRNEDIPRPFIIRPPSDARPLYHPGEPLVFDLVLIGRAIDHLPHFLVTFRELGRIGIGPARKPFELRQVDAVYRGAPERVYDGASNIARPGPAPLTASEILDGGRKPPAPSAPCTRILIRFQTPTHLRADGRVVRRPEFHHVIKRLRDRVNALAYFFADGDELFPGEPDRYRELGRLAETVKTTRCDVRWVEQARRSARTGQRHELSGVVGEAEYEGSAEAIAACWPLLALGEWLHVGRHTVWGNGRYTLIVQG